MTEHFSEDTLRDIGRITVLAGAVRFCLLSAVDALLFTRLGDQGFGRLTLRDAEFERLGIVLHRTAVVTGPPEPAPGEIQAFISRYLAPMRLASLVSTGMWTFLGIAIGVRPATFGLFQDTVLRGSNFRPDWQKLSTDDLRQLADTLGAAHESACLILHATQGFSPNRQRPPKPECSELDGNGGPS